jgi:hypothetical protein
MKLASCDENNGPLLSGTSGPRMYDDYELVYGFDPCFRSYLFYLFGLFFLELCQSLQIYFRALLTLERKHNLNARNHFSKTPLPQSLSPRTRMDGL